MITVLVGPAEQQFIVHKNIICARSKFFEAACSERWLKSAKKLIALPEVLPQVFQKYLSWAYSGELDLSWAASKDMDTLKVVDGLLYETDRMVARGIELYLLGDRLDDIGLRNKTIRMLVSDTSKLPRPSTAHRVWDNTPENSPIRRMIVDRATMLTKRTFLAQSLAKYPEDFVQQVALSLLEDVPTKNKECFMAKLPTYLEEVKGNDC